MVHATAAVTSRPCHHFAIFNHPNNRRTHF